MDELEPIEEDEVDILEEVIVNTTGDGVIEFTGEVMGGIVEDGGIETTGEIMVETTESRKESNGQDEAHAVELVALSIVDADISTSVDEDESVVMSDDNRVTVMMADDYEVGEEVNKDEFIQYISDVNGGTLPIVEENTTSNTVEGEGVVNRNEVEDVNLADEESRKI